MIKLCATLLLCFAAAPAALAQEPAFAGRWKITGAIIAPWAVPGRSADTTEEKRLVGQTVTFARSVTGPSPLGCARPKYDAHDDPPDMLFEGALAEPDASGKPRDADALAHGLGMTTKTVRTLETGCSEVAFHRMAPDTLLFGLNDRIYTLRRDAPR